ncbi:MAG: UvrD-helicase domain-containing protein [Cyclobacteriaceae bacterium]|nr:UvrD-helicase domain-containing protein [Cyclobacteriaceae bacterium]
MKEGEATSYLEQLNPEQRKAVECINGPSLIIAGAGSGKTRVLTYKIAHLIRNHKVDPFNILALTFTNKAASEMRQRIEKIVGNEARNIWMGTFHSVFARILRIDGHRIGYPSKFTIYDTDDSKSLLKAIIKELNLDDKVYKPNTVYNRISAAKNRLISWKEYQGNPIFTTDDEAAMKPLMGKIFQVYVERCFKASAMDFDDLLYNTYVLYRDHTDVLNKYQQFFHYVLIDEFQDTNIAQYVITKKLAAVRQNLTVVGDDAQSIYAFRGAEIYNILNLEKDYPDLQVFKLEQNYRSTRNIVNAANTVIIKNKAQLPKKLWTHNPEGELIELIKANSDNEEGKLVASSIFEEKVNHQLQNSDFAVLYRTNSQSRSIEEALRRNNIKYKIIGGLSFYQRREIKDILGYLRFSINHNDEQALKRIINLPKRGIGAGTINKIVVTAYENKLSLWEVIENISNTGSGRSAGAIIDFVNLIKRFEIEIQKRDAYSAANLIAKESGLLKELYEDKTIEGLNRYENVQELLNAIKEFVDNTENEDKSLSSFLQEVALITSIDEDEADDQDKVTLMTIHMAKGLEFRHVYIVGMEEDLFPSQMMLSSRADLEEERRLFYVALTRAMEKLTLSYAITRYRFGRLKSCEPSRFLGDIHPQFIRVTRSAFPKIDSNINYSSYDGISGHNFTRNLQKQPKRSVSKHIPSPDFTASDTSSLSTGMKVEHPKFGYGVVVEMDEEGANRKAKVKFDNFGVKTLLLTFAKLKICN